MTPETAETLFDWLTTPQYREIVITCAFIFLPVGFSLGLVLSNPFWRFMDRALQRRADSRAAEKRAADKRAADEAAREEARCNRLISIYGVYWDRRQTPFCPVCQSPTTVMAALPSAGLPFVYCHKCSKRIHIMSRHGRAIRALREEIAQTLAKEFPN